jgi:hypothetical protein
LLYQCNLKVNPVTIAKYVENFAAVLFVAALSIGSANALAEESAHGNDLDHHENVVGIFAGITHGGRRKNEPALGVEYARHISGNFSIGAVAEYTFGDAEVWVFVVPFAYSVGHWKMYVAPGIEDGHHGKENLVRLGVERAFEMSGGWEIAPQLNVDFVDGEDVWVIGALIARRF